MFWDMSFRYIYCEDVKVYIGELFREGSCNGTLGPYFGEWYDTEFHIRLAFEI